MGTETLVYAVTKIGILGTVKASLLLKKTAHNFTISGIYMVTKEAFT